MNVTDQLTTITLTLLQVTFDFTPLLTTKYSYELESKQLMLMTNELVFIAFTIS
jgi:hypothetical protein